MRQFSAILIMAALTITLLSSCQMQQQPTQPASSLRAFNAAAEIAQPPDMAFRTVQNWLVNSFPATAQPVQAIDEQQGEIRAQVQFDAPCASGQDCQLRQDRKINATLRIKIMPQRVALNFSNLSLQPTSASQPAAISQPSEQLQVKAQLQAIARSLFAELAMP